jgi:pimeloyl-ACP methyl ester carboxylesterase
MVDYAIVLLLGTGGAKDAKSGCAMLRKGADAGEVRAIFIYGHCLEEGLAGGKQPGQALEYYERAGASGHLAAMRAAARMLDVGRGGKPNGAKAALWLRKALAAGDSRLASDLITAPHVWSIATRRALQRLLKEEGHYAGPADGQFTANFDEVLWSSGLVGELATRDERLIQEIVRVPAKGAPHGILVRLCRSQSSEAKQLVVINHGLTTDVKQRRETRANACGGTAQFFAARGYTVAFPLRRGYGETGGAFNEVGPTACQSFRNLTRAGHEIAKDIRRVIEYLRERTDILRDRTIVVGHSGGGWGALALASDAPKDVAGLINVSGALGSRKGMPNTYCSERHISAAADFGRTAAVPSLWIYVENDSHVGPRVARQMHTAFARGGSKSELVVLPKFETEGHNLFRDSAVETWGPTVDKWLKSFTSGGVAERH